MCAGAANAGDAGGGAVASTIQKATPSPTILAFDFERAGGTVNDGYDGLGQIDMDRYEKGLRAGHRFV